MFSLKEYPDTSCLACYNAELTRMQRILTSLSQRSSTSAVIAATGRALSRSLDPRTDYQRHYDNYVLTGNVQELVRALRHVHID